MFFEFLHRPPCTAIERLKYREFIKSVQNISDAEIISIDPDPLNKKEEKIEQLPESVEDNSNKEKDEDNGNKHQ